MDLHDQKCLSDGGYNILILVTKQDVFIPDIFLFCIK